MPTAAAPLAQHRDPLDWQIAEAQAAAGGGAFDEDEDLGTEGSTAGGHSECAEAPMTLDSCAVSTGAAEDVFSRRGRDDSL